MRGEAGERPLLAAFKQSYSDGALLTVVSSVYIMYLSHITSF